MEESIQAITIVVLTWSSEITNSYEEDQQTQQIIAEVLIQPESQPNYSYNQGVLKFNGRIYVGSVGGLR